MWWNYYIFSSSIDIFHCYYIWIVFLSIRTVNLTRGDKLRALCGTTGTVIVRWLESLTLSRCYAPKEDIRCILEELYISVEVIPTQKIVERLRRLRISNLYKFEYSVSFSTNTTHIFSIYCGLSNVSGWKYDWFTVPHTAICRQHNTLSGRIKYLWNSELF